MKSNTIFDATDNMYYLNSGSISIGNTAESNILMDELVDMVEGLDENLRLPFTMHYEGYKYQEIADELSLPQERQEPILSLQSLIWLFRY